MGFDIDFLGVGDGEKGGDAIAARWGNLVGNRSEQTVIVVDGGTKDSGEDLVNHIKKHYGTDEVDFVISTHPDIDHVSGLTVVLEKMRVNGLVMHRPWLYDLKDLFKNGKITNTSLKEKLRKSLENAYELEELAKQKNIKIYDAFSDYYQDATASLILLGPSKDFYKLLVANFRSTPSPKDEISLLAKALKSVQEGISWVMESLSVETLKDPDENATSAENNSSAILLLNIEGKKILLTGDAGCEALTGALIKAKRLGIDLKDTTFFQVPHHGSKHNVGPSILEQLIGPKLSQVKEIKTAFISAPKKGDPKHPSRKVVNALIRRGARVLVTAGVHTRHFLNAPDRPGWNSSGGLSLYDKVED